MTSDGWKAWIIRCVRESDAGDPRCIDLLAKHLEMTDQAKQKLRDHGFGWTGLDLLKTIDQVIELAE